MNEASSSARLAGNIGRQSKLRAGESGARGGIEPIPARLRSAMSRSGACRPVAADWPRVARPIAPPVGMRRSAIPDPPRRHLAVPRQSDQSQGTGLPVRQRAEARGGRLVLAGNAGRARPHRGRGCTVRRRRTGLERRRPPAGAVVPHQCRSGGDRRPRASDPRRARHADLRAHALHPGACRRRRP